MLLLLFEFVNPVNLFLVLDKTLKVAIAIAYQCLLDELNLEFKDNKY